MDSTHGSFLYCLGTIDCSIYVFVRICCVVGLHSWQLPVSPRYNRLFYLCLCKNILCGSNILFHMHFSIFIFIHKLWLSIFIYDCAHIYIENIKYLNQQYLDVFQTHVRMWIFHLPHGHWCPLRNCSEILHYKITWSGFSM